jgi:MFS family permease
MTVITRGGLALKTLAIVGLVVTFLNFDISKVFLGAFFLKMTGNYRDIGTYVATALAAQMFTFLALSRRVSSGQISVRKLFQYGFTFSACTFAALSIFHERIPEMPILFAAFQGIGLGLFWIPLNIVMFQAFRPGERGKLFAAMPLVAALVGIIGRPVQGWTVAHLGGYGAAFANIAMVYFFVGLFFKVFYIDEIREKSTYDFAGFVAKAQESFSIRRALYGFGLLGWTVLGPLDFILPAVLYKKLGSELTLGMITACLPFIDMTMSFLVGRSGYEKRLKILKIAAVLGFMGAIALSISQTLTMILIFMVLWAVCAPVLVISSNILSAAVTDLVPAARDHQFEYIALREISIASQRIVSIAIGIALSYVLTGETLVSWLLRIAAVGVIVQSVYLVSVARGVGHHE